MSLNLKLSIISFVVVYLIYIVFLIKKNKFDLKYSLLWMFTGVFILFTVIFSKQLNFDFNLIGIEVLSNGVFVTFIVSIILILIAITSIVSTLKKKNTHLIQHLALLEKRLRTLENQINGYTIKEEKS
jgi:hypothetical protein